MLIFLWHLRGSVPLESENSNTVTLDRIEQLLAKQWKSVSERGSDYLVFDDPLWRNPFGPNWLAMVIYDRGRFWIEQEPRGRRLRYDLRSLHGMIFCLFAAFTAFFLGMANDGLPGGLHYAVGAFAWLYGMNILLALLRVPPSIRRATAKP
jgi:hypothetical protein